ncbi:MAG: hypothetical protein U0412_14955 [Nitrospira sp.]
MVVRRVIAPTAQPEPVRESFSYWHFGVGVGIIALLLTVGEGIRLKLDLGSRATSRLILDSLLIGFTDLAGALGIGALAWVAVWILLSYEGIRFRPCPKRTTLGAIACAAGLIFLGRLTPLDVISHYLLQGLLILAISIPAYFAGSRHWLGKW